MKEEKERREKEEKEKQERLNKELKEKQEKMAIEEKKRIEKLEKQRLENQKKLKILEKQQYLYDSEKKEEEYNKIINEVIKDKNIKNNYNYCSIMFNSIIHDFDYSIPYYLTKEYVNNEILKNENSLKINY